MALISSVFQFESGAPITSSMARFHSLDRLLYITATRQGLGTASKTSGSEMSLSALSRETINQSLRAAWFDVELTQARVISEEGTSRKCPSEMRL